MVKCLFFYRGSEFGSQYPTLGYLKIPVTLAPRDQNELLYSVWVLLQTHAHKHISKIKHIFKIIKSKKWKRWEDHKPYLGSSRLNPFVHVVSVIINHKWHFCTFFILLQKYILVAIMTFLYIKYITSKSITSLALDGWLGFQYQA